MKIKQKIAALGVGVALLGGGSAIALATSGASSAATGSLAASAAAAQAAPQQGQQGAKAGGRKPGALMRRVVHGDLTVRTKNGFEKVTYDRGTVTAKSGDGFTIKRPDNVSVTVKVADTTKYKGIQSFDQLQVNQPAIVLSKDGTAVMVGQRTAAKAGAQAPARSGGAGATPADMTEDPLI